MSGRVRDVVRGCWRSKWNLLRLLLAGTLLWALVEDTGARLARRELARMPDVDLAAEVARLRESGRLGEAVMVADAGLSEEHNADKVHRLEIERERTLRDQGSWLRRAKEFGTGALVGVNGAGGDKSEVSVEMLLGAITADFFVVGDIRDLVIQSGRYMRTGEADSVIVALSAVGIATTLTPEIDWAPSVLKAARRAGAMSERFGELIVKAVKGRQAREVEMILEDVAKVSKTTSPAGAVRVLRLVETPAELGRVAGFVERQGVQGALALHTGGKDAVEAIRVADGLRSGAKGAEEAARVERAVVAAGKKGELGRAWLRRVGYRALVKPHVLVGAMKAAWSGHAGDLSAALVEGMIGGLGAVARWAVPILAMWVFWEAGMVARKVGVEPFVQGRGG